jgi:ABC-type branched-subunit amino acid transport system ATPase component
LYATIGGSTNNPAVFNPLVGLFWVAVAVTFGVRRPGGVVLAGVVSQFAPQIINHVIPNYVPWLNTTSTQIPTILFGLGAIQLAKNPDGIVSLVGQQRWQKRRKRLLKEAAKVPEPVAVLEEAGAQAEAEEARLAALRSAEDSAIAAEVDRHASELVERGVVSTASDGGTAAAVRADAALVLEGVRAGYGEVEVLHGVNLVLPGGGITGLFGANGAGKSTLCNTIGGLVDSTEGTITVEGREIRSMPAHLRARMGVVVVPESRGIFSSLSVEENLSVWLPNAGEREEALAAFPLLRERRRLPAGNLSGGEQQMLTLAAVLVRPPKLLVADEPTLGLAPLVIEQLMRVFEDLRDRGVTLLLVEEKVRDVLDIADTVAFIELGHVIWSGPRSELDNARLAAAYLGQAQLSNVDTATTAERDPTTT